MIVIIVQFFLLYFPKMCSRLATCINGSELMPLHFLPSDSFMFALCVILHSTTYLWYCSRVWYKIVRKTNEQLLLPTWGIQIDNFIKVGIALEGAKPRKLTINHQSISSVVAFYAKSRENFHTKIRNEVILTSQSGPRSLFLRFDL